MFEWSEEHRMIRDAVREFVDKEVRPHRDELEHGDMAPYDLLRKLYRTFGMDQMAAAGFDRRLAADEAGSGAASGSSAAISEESEESEGGGRSSGMTMLPIIELCKCS